MLNPCRAPARLNVAPSAILSAMLLAMLPAIPSAISSTIPRVTRSSGPTARRSAILPAMLNIVLTAILISSAKTTAQSIAITRENDAVSYHGYKLYRASVFPGQLPIVDSLDGADGVEIWNWLYKPDNFTYEMDVLSAPERDKQVKEVFDDVQLKYDVVIDDLQKEIETENVNEGFLLDNRNGHPMSWESYHSFEDMETYMYYLEQTYPDYVTVLNIGSSFEGRDLLVVKVSTSDSGNTSRPAIWVDGGMHAREWVSPAVVSYLLQRLVEIPDNYTSIVDAFDWYIMPMVNPDGYEYSRTHDRLWRKTRSKHHDSPCFGADLNRNFGYMWNSGGSSGDPCSDIFRGVKPFSEPESRALRDFLLLHRDQLKVYVSIHAYKQLWMYPWGYHHGRMADLLYVISGSSNDYAHGHLGIPYSFALELRDRGEHGYLLPRDQIEPTAEETTIGLFAMAQEVAHELQ
ncbi:carboxypeptidase B [Hyalella azteca]|uniref:Carboxypeptidase B n=1 Tax=Hyalella azteca TaxID=294128 RepID=A0A979FGU9_HYAAZ|nr:carboxypeptidase B [Hyalella azteca]